MELHKSQTVLILPVVRLTSSPDKPVDGCVPVRPDPFAVVMVGIVISICLSCQPELVELSNLGFVQQLRFQPVVDSGMVKFSNPSFMESTQNIGIVPGDRFSTTQHEASASTSVLLQHPATRTRAASKNLILRKSTKCYSPC